MSDQLPGDGGAVLPDAAARLDIAVSLMEQGWIQEEWKSRDGSQVCAGQAILDSYGQGIAKDRHKALEALRVSAVVCAAIRKHHSGCGDSIANFNDKPATTLAKVLEVFATARRWIVDGTCGSDTSETLHMSKRGKRRLNRFLAKLHNNARTAAMAA